MVSARFISGGSAIAVGGLLVALAGCGSHTAHATATEVIEASRAHYYSSVTELGRDSTLVAMIRPTGQTTVEQIGGIPFTISTVAVQRTIKGRSSSTTLRLRETGSNTTVGDVDPLVSKGRTYVAFMQPFELTPGKATGQWVLTGAGAGLFSLTGSTMTKLDPESPQIPSTLSADMVASGLRP